MLRPLARAVARDAIERSILNGELTPGDQVKLADLATLTGLGLTPLREGMIEAARTGLLESRPGRGFFVPPLTLEEITELYPMIWGLEALAVRLTPRFTHPHLARLRDINSRFASQADDPRGALELDSAWHRTLVAECGNRLIIQTLADVKVRSRRYEFAFQRSAGHLPISVSHHEAIVQALESSDRDAAMRLVEENWAAGPRFMGEWLTRQNRRA